jgi:hypothetical protein
MAWRGTTEARRVSACDETHASGRQGRSRIPFSALADFATVEEIAQQMLNEFGRSSPVWWPKITQRVPGDIQCARGTHRGQADVSRCLQWAAQHHSGDKAAKQPHLFTAADGSPILAFAGLWDRWHDRAAGEEVLACMAIVCERICNCLKATAASATAAWSS